LSARALLASFYLETGRKQAAEAMLLTHVLAIFERDLPPDDEATQQVRQNLAYTRPALER